MSELYGRFIKHNDGSFTALPPCTYDDFVESGEWDGASDLEWKEFKRAHGYIELDEFDDDYLNEGFAVLPASAELNELVRPTCAMPNSFVSENPLMCGREHLATEYARLFLKTQGEHQ